MLNQFRVKITSGQVEKKNIIKFDQAIEIGNAIRLAQYQKMPLSLFDDRLCAFAAVAWGYK